MKALRIAALVAGLAALAGAAHGAGDLPRPYAASETRIAGGTAPQRALLRSILRRFRSTGIRQLTIVPAAGARSVAVAARYGAGDPESGWESRLVTGVFADESAARGLPRVTRFDVGVVASERTGPVHLGGSAFPLTPRMRAGVRWATHVPGVRVVAFRRGLPGGHGGVTLVLEVRHPAWFLVYRLPYLQAALWNDRPTLRVQDRRGNTVLRGTDIRSATVWAHLTGSWPNVFVRRGARPRLRAERVQAIARQAIGRKPAGLFADHGVRHLCHTIRVCPMRLRAVMWLASFDDGSWALIDDRTGRVRALHRG